MPRYVWIVDAISFAALFVGVPAMAAVIGRAAWLGKPEKWDRSMYWTAAIASGAAAVVLMVLAQRMRADVRTWRYLVQIALFGLGIVSFGVGAGSFVGIFVYGRGKGPAWRGAATRDRPKP